MPVSLFAWESNLYLLAKHGASPSGGTPWWLIRLAPRDGEELGRVRLPTQAAHLNGGTLIEKGPVQGIGDTHAPYMETSSMVLLPSAWLDGRTKARAARASCE